MTRKKILQSFDLREAIGEVVEEWIGSLPAVMNQKGQGHALSLSWGNDPEPASPTRTKVGTGTADS